MSLAPDASVTHQRFDETMELGVSHDSHVEDVDFDLVSDDDLGVDENLMDATDDADHDLLAMQADDERQFVDDDEMLDDDVDVLHDSEREDLNMDSYEQEEVENEQEHIPVDRGSLSTALPDAHNGTGETTDLAGDTESHLTHTEAPPNVVEHLPDVEEMVQADKPEAKAHFEASVPATVDSVPATLDNSIDPDHISDPTEGTGVSQEGSAVADADIAVSHTNLARDQTSSSPGVSSADHKAPASESLLAESTNPGGHQADEDLGVHPTSEDAEPVADDDEDAEAAKEDETTLHPIMVEYDDQVMSLFPPAQEDSADTFFLTDTSLASQPLETLLAACREILGDSLEHHDELVLDIPTLGLHISEDSKYAASLTLTQVLDVYVKLARNDTPDAIDPLTCHLTSRICLASQYVYLANAVVQGKSFSEIAAEHVESPEPFEQQEDEVEPQPYVIDKQEPREGADDDHQEVSPESAAIQATESLIDVEQSAAGAVVEDEEDLLEAADLLEDGDDLGASDVVRQAVDTTAASKDATEQLSRADSASVALDHEDEHALLPPHIDAHKEVEDLDHTNQDAEAQSVSSHTVATDGHESEHPSPIGPASTNTEDGALLGHPDADDVSGSNGVADASGPDGPIKGPTDNLAEELDYIDDELGIDEPGQPLDDASAGVEAGTALNGVDPLDLPETETALPATPSKQSSEKRKASDDLLDEDLFDFTTPEFKRSRAS